MHIKNTTALISNLLKPGATLSQRVVRGGFWMFALRITDRLIKLACTIILARVLAPADFGLFGIALLTMAALETFSQTGLNAALVQKKQDIATYLDTAWTIQAIRGGLLALVLFAAAPYVAAFFATPAAKPILQVIGLSILIQGLANIGVIYFQKELEFHKQYAYQISGTLAYVGVAIAAVWLLGSVWALVFGLLAGDLVRLAMSYIIHPYRPRPRLSWDQFKELFHFGKWVLGSSMLMYLYAQGDSIFVGKLLGATALGFYQMAYRISNLPATEITHLISKVTFPAYAKLQADIPKLKEAYLKVLQLTVFLSFPLAGLIFVLAPDFTRIFLGEKWLPMVPAMQVLVFWGLIRSIGATTGPIFLAIGMPKIVTKLQLLQMILLFIFIYPFTISWGILGTCFAVILSAILPNVLAFFKVIKLTNCGIYNFFRTIAFPVVITIFATVIIITLQNFWFNYINIATSFISSIIVFSAIYFAMSYLFCRELSINLRSLIKEMH